MPNPQQSLYHSSFEHDACGIGALVNIKGQKSHQIVDDALSIVEKLEHRAGKDASGETATVSASSCRFRTNFSPPSQTSLKSISVRSGIMA